MNVELKGKTVLVTGASKGIGLACARAFARVGCSLHLAARDPDRLRLAAQEISAIADVPIKTHPTDLSSGDAARDLIDRCSDVDILVNNAGAIPGGTIEKIDENTWRAAWDLKVFGYINTTRAMLTYMYPRKSGVIINIVGMGGVTLRYDYVCGAAGNAALIGFTKAVGSRSVDHGVRVVAINPPGVRTDRLVEVCRSIALERFGDADRWEELMQDVPFGRACEPDEVADMVVFAASPRASYLSGTAINLDGGLAHRG